MLNYLGWQEILLIVALIMIVFGARRIPEYMRALGEGFTILRREVTRDEEDEPQGRN